jgi:hypothetical protein
MEWGKAFALILENKNSVKLLHLAILASHRPRDWEVVSDFLSKAGGTEPTRIHTQYLNAHITEEEKADHSSHANGLMMHAFMRAISNAD